MRLSINNAEIKRFRGENVLVWWTWSVDAIVVERNNAAQVIQGLLRRV